MSGGLVPTNRSRADRKSAKAAAFAGRLGDPCGQAAQIRKKKPPAPWSRSISGRLLLSGYNIYRISQLIA
jgi:hypothetical protein